MSNKANKYPEGYKPKILYWNQRLQDALYASDYYNANKASEKLAYFTAKQAEVEAIIAKF